MVSIGYFILSSIWGATIGPHFGVSFFNFEFGRVMSLVVFGIGITLHWILSPKVSQRYSKIFFYVLSGIIWGVVHSPAEFAYKNTKAKVVWASGCRATENDLLVSYEEFVFVAKGFAVQGDEVMLDPKKVFGSSHRVKVIAFAQTDSWVCEFGSAFRTLFHEKIARFPWNTAQWFRGFVLGEKSSLNAAMTDMFRDLGLLHILVLSGGHLIIVSSFLLLVLRLPVAPFYIMRFISVQSWAAVWCAIQCLLVLFLGIFCLVVGFSQSVQRAFILVAVINLAGIFGFNLPPRRKILAVLVLQILCFPVHLLSLSMLLSWSGSLILIAFSESDYMLGLWQRLKLLLLIQLVFFASSLLFFGRAGVLSPFANLAGHLVFGILLPINVLAIVANVNWLDRFVISVNNGILTGIELVASFQQFLPVPLIYVPKNFTINTLSGRALMVGFFVLLFWLTKFKRISHRNISLK